MRWNWQRPDWPQFSWDPDVLSQAEAEFLVGSGVVVGISSHLPEAENEQLRVGLLRDEALTTSEIEGEVLDRASVQSSIRYHLGLDPNARRGRPSEQGIAEMMVDLHRSFDVPLTHEVLCSWHAQLMQGRRGLEVGTYRTHQDPMRVVSGSLDRETIHFEAPPSTRVRDEMHEFLEWFSTTSPTGAEVLPPLTRSGIAHLYFECIHPFEDGNGRIGRAIAEKALAESLGRPAPLLLAPTILARRKEYYHQLEANNKQLEITAWLRWFASVALEAQCRLQSQLEFLVDKAKYLDQFREQLNERQHKVLLRVLREGPSGFEGGLSASNYVAITKTSTATATRDLRDLVDKGAFTRTGERRHARYHVTLPPRHIPRITIAEDGSVVRTPSRTERK